MDLSDLKPQRHPDGIAMMPPSMLLDKDDAENLNANDKRKALRGLLHGWNTRVLEDDRDTWVIPTQWTGGATSDVCMAALVYGVIPEQWVPENIMARLDGGTDTDETAGEREVFGDTDGEAPQDTPKAVPATGGIDINTLLDVLGKELASRIPANIDEKAVEAIARRIVGEAGVPRRVIVEEPAKGREKDVGLTHYLFDLVLKLAEQRVHPMLVGPSGSGKTYLAWQVAQALGLPWYCESVCETTSEFSIIGSIDAHGQPIRTGFREAYENGGVFVLDEVDRGGASLIVLNSALSGNVCPFPDMMVERHPDFVLIATANTYGLGGNREYCGAVQIDAATLNRMFLLDFPYDEHLEFSLIGAQWPEVPFDMERGGTAADPNRWAKRISGLRRAAEKLGERLVISPRATITGWQLLQCGIGRHWVEHGLIWQGRDQSIIDKVNAAAGGY
jgi:cobaltochelatase CobS